MKHGKVDFFDGIDCTTGRDQHGKRLCACCGQSLNTETLAKSWLVAGVVDLCQCCNQPLILPYGYCPKCGDQVYEYEDRFACKREVWGKCEFSLRKRRFGGLRVEEARRILPDLLVGTSRSVVFGPGKPWVLREAEMLFDKAKGWSVKVTEVEYHNQC